MQIGSKRVKFAIAAATMAWLVGVAFVTASSAPAEKKATASPTVLKTPAAPGPIPGSTCTNPSPAPSYANAQAVAPGTTPKPQTSDQAFKDIRVLKGLPVDEFMGTMGLFSAALSMCCLECHQADWAADTPRKITARKMVAMVNTINQTNFSGRKVVTCWTCHRQLDRPSVTPPLDIVYGEPIFWAPDDFFQQTPGAPKPEDVLNKYIQAVGGADRVARLTSLVGKGTASGFGKASFGTPAELYAKAPNQRTVIQHTELGQKTMTFDGHSGWLASPVTPVPVMEYTGGELDGARLDAELTFPGRIKQVLGQWRANLPATINERRVNILQGTSATGAIATLYFDFESGLLTRVVRYASSAMGRVPTQIDFSDYREVSGVKVPFKWSFAWVSGRDEIELKEVQANVAIDAARFAKPAPAVAPK